MATKEELEQQLEQTRKDMRILASMATDSARTALADVGGSAEHQLTMLSADARALYDDVADEGRRLTNAAGDRIREKPLASAGIAFAIGLVIGGLLSGRR